MQIVAFQKVTTIFWPFSDIWAHPLHHHRHHRCYFECTKKTAHKICTRQAANIRSFNNEIMLYFIQIIYGIVCKRVFVFKPQKHYFRWSDIAVWLCPLNKMHIYKSILCPVVFFLARFSFIRFGSSTRSFYELAFIRYTHTDRMTVRLNVVYEAHASMENI